MTVTKPAPGAPRDSYNVIEIGKLDPKVANGRPFVNAVGGSYAKLGPLNTGDAETNSYNLWSSGHEAGHLMGLPDMYTGRFPIPQYEGNIMAEPYGKSESLDVSNIIYLKSVGNNAGHGKYPGPGSTAGK